MLRGTTVRALMKLLLASGVLAGISGCGSDEIDTSRLKATWKAHQSEHFVFYYPPDSPRAQNMPVFAGECEEILAHAARVLQAAPDQPMDFFLFTTDAQADSLVHRRPGFFADGQIFLRIGQHPGGPIALAACSVIDPRAPSFPILRTGMYSLYAQPSVNVHARTFGFDRQNRFIPLPELADTTYVKDRAVYEAQAASLCAYLLARFGPEKFKMLWRSTLGFTDSLEKIYRVEISKFESDWRVYYRKEAGRT